MKKNLCSLLFVAAVLSSAAGCEAASPESSPNSPTTSTQPPTSTTPEKPTVGGYLPLAEGRSWVLRNSSERTPVTIEVIGHEGDSYLLRFTSPWSSNDWKLKVEGGKAFLSGFGVNGKLMPLPADTVFFDFSSKAGTTWTNAAGKLSVKSRDMTVNTATRKIDNAIDVQQVAGDSTFDYVFANDIGFVQFEASKIAFVLDESASKLAGSGAGTSGGAGPSRPTPHVPSGPLPKSKTGAGLLLGTTVTTFANEDETPQNLMKRFDQTTDAGVTYISGAGKWTELEPSKGNYKLDPINFQTRLAENHGARMSYTLRMIDTIHKAVPADLEKKGWRDEAMQARALALIEALAPLLKDRVQWFMFGNEIDGYFKKHPDEIADFVALYSKVEKRLKELVPGIQVSSTLMFGGIEDLDGALKPLDETMDFLSFTYYPMEADFTVQDPEAPLRDFPRMKQSAKGRKIVLQEIGYPTGSANKSSEKQQATFYQNVVDQMRADPQTFVAGSFFLLADLRDKAATDLASYYEISGYEPFRAFLQTLGMFDTAGKPKQSWEVFTRALKP